MGAAADVAEFIFITPATPVVLGLGWAGIVDISGATPETYLGFCAITSTLLWVTASVIAFFCGWYLLVAWILCVLIMENWCNGDSTC